jgi:prepilin-type N-terminal cleavage/methylation domain-containing protein
MQGGARGVARGVPTRTSQRRASAPTQQVGLFQQPGRGVTLIEMLISTALFSFVMAGVYLLYTTMQGTMIRGEMKTDLQQNARVGLGRMVQELRMAGYDPSNALASVALAPRDAIRAAGPSCLSIVAYEMDAGTSPPTPRSAQVTYLLDGTVLRRRQDPWVAASNAFTGGSGQPLAEGVNSLTFAYFDYLGNAIAVSPITTTQRCPPLAGQAAQVQSLLDNARLPSIARIEVTLQTRESRPGVSPEFFTLKSHVVLRNR